MDPSHLQRSLFQRTLAPKAWGGGAKALWLWLGHPLLHRNAPHRAASWVPGMALAQLALVWDRPRAQPDMAVPRVPCLSPPFP